MSPRLTECANFSHEVSIFTGKLIFHLMEALAEFERDLIRERTNAGLVKEPLRANTFTSEPAGMNGLLRLPIPLKKLSMVSPREKSS